MVMRKGMHALYVNTNHLKDTHLQSILIVILVKRMGELLQMAALDA
jgi:hypothetical protein